jgi:hypothetical protein
MEALTGVGHQHLSRAAFRVNTDDPGEGERHARQQAITTSLPDSAPMGGLLPPLSCPQPGPLPRGEYVTQRGVCSRKASYTGGFTPRLY